MSGMETIIFDGDDGIQLEFGILEQTRVNGHNYLLVVDCLLYTSRCV